MTEEKLFDVIIIGGSYAGLSAAMALGRSLRNVLILDSGKPCNRQTPHSHNFITQDGEEPNVISEKAKEQVLKYRTVKFRNATAVSAKKNESGFAITTEKGEIFKASKLLFATGIKDMMPNIQGISECWGISVVHCPYCHGYEIRGERTGILANGDFAYHYAQLVSNLTKEVTVFTNGKAAFSNEQLGKLEQHNIPVIEKDIAAVKHHQGNLEQIVFQDDTTFELKALYLRPSFEQHCKIPEDLGCELTEHGLLKIDMFQKTTVPNVFACGDNSSPMRSIANAVSTGNVVGAMINHEMTQEQF